MLNTVYLSTQYLHPSNWASERTTHSHALDVQGHAWNGYSTPPCNLPHSPSCIYGLTLANQLFHTFIHDPSGGHFVYVWHSDKPWGQSGKHDTSTIILLTESYAGSVGWIDRRPGWLLYIDCFGKTSLRTYLGKYLNTKKEPAHEDQRKEHSKHLKQMEQSPWDRLVLFKEQEGQCGQTIVVKEESIMELRVDMQGCRIAGVGRLEIQEVALDGSGFLAQGAASLP